MKYKTSILWLLTGIFSLATLFFGYVVFKFAYPIFSTSFTTLRTMSVYFLPLSTAAITLLFGIAAYASSQKTHQFAQISKLASTALQLATVLYVSNFAVFLTTLKISHAATTGQNCYSAADITADRYCLLLARSFSDPNNPGPYRVLNPQNTTNNPSNPSSHQGNPCQTYGPVPNSAIMYNATDDFYTSTGLATALQRTHRAVIDFAAFVSIAGTGKISVDQLICPSVSISATDVRTGLVTLTDPASTPTPTPVPSSPTPTPFNAPTATQTPQPSITPSPTPTPRPTLTPIPTSTPLPSATPTPRPTSTPTPSPRPTASPTPTPRPTNTPIPTLTPKPTITPAVSAYPTITLTPTKTPSPTPIITQTCKPKSQNSFWGYRWWSWLRKIILKRSEDTKTEVDCEDTKRYDDDR